MINEKGMELPIAVMIVFFVSIAVALIVINFAGQLIGMGEAELKKFTLDSDKAEFFIETNTVTSGTMANLASQCYKDHGGTYEGDKICYIVHATDGVSFDQAEVSDRFHQAVGLDPVELGEQIIFDAWDGVGRTVYIKFDERNQIIAIES